MTDSNIKKNLSCCNSTLTVARTKKHCSCLGPGVRAVIWFHGCSKKCPGCIAKEMNSSAEHETYTPEELYAWLESINGISGLTLSGGEPFEQDWDSLLRFLVLVKSSSRGYNVICFTGKKIEEIQKDASASRILQYLDVLIDGEYIDGQNDASDLRGSANQRICFLSHEFDLEKQSFFGKNARLVEFEFSTAGTLEISGIPQSGFLRDIQKHMAESGITVNF